MHGLWFDHQLDEATDTGRIHHQLVPNDVKYEFNVDSVSASVNGTNICVDNRKIKANVKVYKLLK